MVNNAILMVDKFSDECKTCISRKMSKTGFRDLHSWDQVVKCSLILQHPIDGTFQII